MKHWPLSAVSVLTLLAACTQTPDSLPDLRATATGYVAADLGVPGQATAVSADGSVIVGHSDAGGQAFRWTASGVQTLGPANLYETLTVSADGKAVVGTDRNDAGGIQAFRWTTTGGRRDLGFLPGDAYSIAKAMSADGSVVVGTSYDSSGDGGRAFRWTASGGMQTLAGLGGDFSEAVDVSADGTVVVGNIDNFENTHRAFRWTVSGGPQLLNGSVFASHVSADGQVTVGRVGGVAYRWTASGTLERLGNLGGLNLRVTAVSADGSVVVGWNDVSFSDERAFRWTAAGGMKSLGTLPGRANSEALAASADGSVVVGRSSGGGGSLAFRWTPAGGMQELPGLPSGAAFASAVSDDGQVAAGLSLLIDANNVYSTRAVRWSLGERPEPKRYTVDVQQAPPDRVLWSLKTGQGVTGPSSPGSVAVYGERRINGRVRNGNHVKALELWGGKRLAVTTAGTATPNPGGGPLRLRFYPSFGDGYVRVKQLRVFNIVSDGATLTLFRRTQPVRQLDLPRTSPGKGVTINLDEPNVTTIRIDAPNAFAVDDVVFEDE